MTAKEQQHETRERILPKRPWKNNTATIAYFKGCSAGSRKHATDWEMEGSSAWQMLRHLSHLGAQEVWQESREEFGLDTGTASLTKSLLHKC